MRRLDFRAVSAVLPAAALLLALLPAPAARAQTDQPSFNLAELDRFMADFPAIVQDLERAGTLDGPADRDGLARAAQEQAYRDAVTSRGWDPERFAYMADHVARGLASDSVREPPLDRSAQLAQAQAMAEAQAQVKAQVMAMPDLTPEMRQQILAQLEQDMGGLAKVAATADNLPPDELTLIRVNRAELVKVFRME